LKYSGGCKDTGTAFIQTAAIGMLLAGCAHNDGFATLTGVNGTGGACSAFEAPKYAIAGKTAYDQKWADKTTEAGVAGCKWKRPQPRPALLDAKPMPVKALPAKKPHWYDRFRKKPAV
jgi:hypothetical protein